jgi:hypothetical protein
LSQDGTTWHQTAPPTSSAVFRVAVEGFFASYVGGFEVAEEHLEGTELLSVDRPQTGQDNEG